MSHSHQLRAQRGTQQHLTCAGQAWLSATTSGRRARALPNVGYTESEQNVNILSHLLAQLASGASTCRAWDERIAGQWQRPRVLTWHHPRASSLKMLGLSLWEGRLPGQKTIENEDKAAIGSYGQKVTLAQATP